MQRNFILTDIMKTGYHQDFEEFIDMFEKIPNPETYPKCFEFYLIVN